MTEQELREKIRSESVKLQEIVAKQANLILDAYQQGWEDCYKLFDKMLKEKENEIQ